MSFTSMNGVNAAKGMAGTARANSATFNPEAAAPIAPGAAVGMQGASAPAHLAQPGGSSYTIGAGMQNTGRAASAQGQASNMIQNGQVDLNGTGVLPGRQGPMADIGQQAPQMSLAEMQDPANAALAGYAFSATQDKPATASTSAGYQPPPAAPQGNPGAGQSGQATGGAAYLNQQSQQPSSPNPVNAALGNKLPPNYLNR
jgi:hypothetical protein